MATKKNHNYMEIHNDKELLEAIKELFSLKKLENELVENIEKINKAIQDYIMDPVKSRES